MVGGFDRIVIAVPGLADATREYRQLLGMEPAPVEGEPQRAWFVLPNTVIELVQAPLERAVIEGLVFASADGGATEMPVANARGLHLSLSDGRRTAAIRGRHEEAGAVGLGVDHLVLRTTDADDCIALFGQQLGIRLALDKTVPEWGGRMLFFRAGKLTLEVIEWAGGHGNSDHFWGIAYQCADLDRLPRQLAARGVSLSDVRAGRKPGSRVATVKSHSLGLPTLLLQPPAKGTAGSV